jgi:hypothetical protein
MCVAMLFSPRGRVTNALYAPAGKQAGEDKQLARELDTKLRERSASIVASSNSEDSRAAQSSSVPDLPESAPLLRSSSSVSSTFGDFSSAHPRQVFAFLVETLNAAYPDYDFRYVARMGFLTFSCPQVRIRTIHRACVIQGCFTGAL